MTLGLFGSFEQRSASLLTASLTPEQIRNYDRILDIIGYTIKFVNLETVNNISVNGRFFIRGEMSTDDAINYFKVSMRYHAKAIYDATERLKTPDVLLNPTLILELSKQILENINIIRGDDESTNQRICQLYQQNLDNLEQKASGFTPR